MGLLAERVAGRAHTSRYRRLPSLPPSLAWTFRLLLALPPGCLDHAGTDVGGTQAKHRTSGPCRNASGRLWKDRLGRSLGCRSACRTLTTTDTRWITPGLTAAARSRGRVQIWPSYRGGNCRSLGLVNPRPGHLSSRPNFWPAGGDPGCRGAGRYRRLSGLGPSGRRRPVRGGPLGAGFVTERGDGRADRREEVARVDRAGQPVAFDLAPHRVLQLGEDQADALRRSAPRRDPPARRRRWCRRRSSARRRSRSSSAAGRSGQAAGPRHGMSWRWRRSAGRRTGRSPGRAGAGRPG